MVIVVFSIMVLVAVMFDEKIMVKVLVKSTFLREDFGLRLRKTSKKISPAARK